MIWDSCLQSAGTELHLQYYPRADFFILTQQISIGELNWEILFPKRERIESMQENDGRAQCKLILSH